jgi:hypothetical protein
MSGTESPDASRRGAPRAPQKISTLSRERLNASDGDRPKLDEAVQRAQDELQTFSETVYLSPSDCPIASSCGLAGPSPYLPSSYKYSTNDITAPSKLCTFGLADSIT